MAYLGKTEGRRGCSQNSIFAMSINGFLSVDTKKTSKADVGGLENYGPLQKNKIKLNLSLEELWLLMGVEIIALSVFHMDFNAHRKMTPACN